MEKFNPGICEVQKALLIPFGETEDSDAARDITGLIANYTIIQGIDRVSLSGNIFVVDKIGLLERLPIRGEEELHFEIKSFDFATVRSIKARIIKIDDVEPAPDGNGVGYTLHFISKRSYDANINYLITSFNGVKGHEAVRKIFEKNYSPAGLQEKPETNKAGEKIGQPEGTKRFELLSEKGRYFYRQETRGNMKLTIPRYTPSEAIKFISRKSFSDLNPSCTYRFFETFDGFYFVTDEWLHDKARIKGNTKILNYFQFSSRDPEDAAAQVSTIQSFRNPRRANVAEEMINGAYRNSVIEIDLLRHVVKRYDYDYLETDAQFIESNKDNINLSKVKKVKQKFKTSNAGTATLSSDIHSEEFIKQTFNKNNAKRFMIIRDYTEKESGSGPSKDETFYRQSAAFRTMYSNHLNATQVTISLKGRLDLEPGEVVNINVRELDAGGESKPNRQLSGRYLIRTVVNNVEGNVLETVCQVSKYDWSDAASDTSEVS